MPSRRLLPLLMLVVVTTATTTALTQPKLPTPTVPQPFDVTIFARPPQVNYPVCLCAAPTGELFVGIDKQGSLGKKKGEGRVERCVDSDGDGVADKFNTFAKMDHPRGLIYDRGKLWVLHPPFLTLYHDDDLDGTADRKETLVTGLTTDQLNKRGADHTTNGIRMGIDGWIYIAVGDFGFVNTKGKDGRTLTLKGGGVVRVRPDGTEMELYCRGLRNILDVCIDPQLNMFTRDNTNDGGGWDIRLSHIVPSANYGYPSLFKNFSDEIMPPLADYGGGSGCGSMFLSESMLPRPYNHALLTCDWGRGAVFYHPLTHKGATYQAGQQEFVKIPRPTDIDVDGSGRIYISSWHGGQFRYAGENVGYVVQLKSKAPWRPPVFPDLTKMTDAVLVQQMLSTSHVRRFYAQREILRRGPTALFAETLTKYMHGGDPLDMRAAALFTYKQLYGAKANAELVKLAVERHAGKGLRKIYSKSQSQQLSTAHPPTVRELALRALTDRKSQLDDVPVELFVQALRSKNQRVILAALVGLGRLGKVDAAKAVLRFAVPPELTGAKSVVPVAAYRSGIIGKKKRSVKINANIKGAKKLFLVATDGGDGNGLDHVAWVNPVLDGTKKLTDLKWTSAKAGWGNVHVNRDCKNRPLKFKGKLITDAIGTHAHSVIAYDLPPGYSKFQARGILDDGSNGRGSVRFYVFTDELPPTYKKAGATVVKDVSKYIIPHIAVQTLIELNAVDVCLAALGTDRHAGAVQALRYLNHPKTVQGLIAKLSQTRNEKLRHTILQTLIRLYHREGEYKGSWWGTRPDTTGPYYHRVPWRATPTIETVLHREITTAPSATVNFMLHELSRHRVTLKNLPPDLIAKAKTRNIAPNINVVIPKFDRNNPNQVGNIPFKTILEKALAHKGDSDRGRKLFQLQSCHACHTTTAGQRPIGPSLLDIAKRYDRKQLLESILKPNAQISQGFATNLFVMNDGKLHTGFIIREAADEIEIRTREGNSHLLTRKQIAERVESKQSIMPEGLVHNLTVAELASLVAYLESLNK